MWLGSGIGTRSDDCTLALPAAPWLPLLLTEAEASRCWYASAERVPITGTPPLGAGTAGTTGTWPGGSVSVSPRCVVCNADCGGGGTARRAGGEIPAVTLWVGGSGGGGGVECGCVAAAGNAGDMSAAVADADFVSWGLVVFQSSPVLL